MPETRPEPARQNARGAVRRVLLRLCRACLISLVASACTEFEPGSDTIEAETVTAAELGGSWGCLDDTPTPSVSDAANAPRVVRSLRVTGFVGEGEVSGVRARACTLRDPDCLSPVTPWMETTVDGWVDVPVYDGFDGYLEITGPGAVPVMVFYSAPLTMNTAVDPDAVFVVDTDTALSFDRLFLGREAFPDTGVINVRAIDCANAPAAGVQFRLEPSAVGWYYVADIPVATADATTESGIGGFSDVRPGTVVVTAELAESGRSLAPPRSVFVRAGWFTNIRFRR